MRLPQVLDRVSPKRRLLAPIAGVVGSASNAVPYGVLAGVIASGLVGAGVARALPLADDILAVADVRPGMKGYGLTVFSGTTPEKFNVEVISTLHNFRPNQISS